MTGAVLIGVMAGAFLAAFFLGGLAITVRWLPRAAHPGVLMLASFAIRAVVVVAAFVLLARESLLAFGVAFGLFVLARFVAVSLFTPNASTGRGA